MQDQHRATREISELKTKIAELSWAKEHLEDTLAATELELGMCTRAHTRTHTHTNTYYTKEHLEALAATEMELGMCKHFTHTHGAVCWIPQSNHYLNPKP